jgi:hypothetical protein
LSLSFQCPKCNGPLRAAALNLPALTPCPSCQVPLRVEVFPALFRPVASGSAGEAVLLEGEASCFYHPEKKAAIPCEACGRFLCALCDCELQGRHFCPGCLESGRKKGKIHFLENRRTRYDDIALALAIYPLLVYPFTILTAPVAIYVAVRYWKAPRGIIRTSKWRYVLAVILALLQLTGWGVLIYSMIKDRRG